MERKQKVLHVFGSLNIGGAESRIMDVLRKIDRKKCTFDFLTMQTKPQFFEDEIVTLGGKVFKIIAPRQRNILKHYKELINIIKENGVYDVVHAHTSYHCGLVMMAAKRCRVPIRISHARTTGTKNRGIGAKLLLIFGRMLIKLFSTELLAVSFEAAQYLFKTKKNVVVIPNAIDLEPYLNISETDTIKLREELGILEGRTVIGHVGRFESMKNHNFLVDLFKSYQNQNPNSTLVLVGDGSLKSEIEKRAQSGGIFDKVIFTGVRSDINLLMNIFNVVIIPSFFEGICGVAVEAQASGTPCILSDSLTTKTDMGLGLCEYISLTQEKRIWIEAIERALKKKSPMKEEIKKKFLSRGYDLISEIKILSEIYNGKRNKVSRYAK